jgi:hypothetical protein
MNLSPRGGRGTPPFRGSFLAKPALRVFGTAEGVQCERFFEA